MIVGELATKELALAVVDGYRTTALTERFELRAADTANARPRKEDVDSGFGMTVLARHNVAQNLLMACTAASKSKPAA